MKRIPKLPERYRERLARLKIRFPPGSVGSIPTFGTCSRAKPSHDKPLPKPVGQRMGQREVTRTRRKTDGTLRCAQVGTKFGTKFGMWVARARRDELAGAERPVGLLTFRHSCASVIFRRGMSKEAIRKMLGHYSWDFTAGTYVHLNEDDLMTSADGNVVGDLTTERGHSTAEVTRSGNSSPIGYSQSPSSWASVAKR
jgi:integrase